MEKQNKQKISVIAINNIYLVGILQAYYMCLLVFLG